MGLLNPEVKSLCPAKVHLVRGGRARPGGLWLPDGSLQ